MKKKFLISLICFIFVIGIIFVYIKLWSGGGDISKVNIIAKNSEIYSQNDIEDAINTTLKYFKKHFNGCKLKEITYIGDEKSIEFQERASSYNKDEAIILVSSFDVNSSNGDGALNPNSEYKEWKWILVRNKNEKWKHVDHGY